jgi:hypothetical protein
MALDETKPHMGSIERWWECPVTSRGLGYIICGHLVDRPGYRGGEGHTSWVVAREGDEVETRNSRYTLVGPPVDPDAV